MSFQDVGNEIKAEQCRAKALMIENEFNQAGEIFEKCENSAEAINAYWLGRSFRRIVEMGLVDPSLTSLEEYRFAEFLVRKTSLKESIKRLEFILVCADSRSTRGSISRNDLTYLTEKVIGKTAELIQAESPIEEELKRIVSKVDSLIELGLASSSSDLATIFYKANRIDEALIYWEGSDDVTNSLYQEAKTQSLLRSLAKGEIAQFTSSDVALLL